MAAEDVERLGGFCTRGDGGDDTVGLDFRGNFF